MKKVSLSTKRILFQGFFLLVFFLLPLLASAQLVHCGGPGQPPCTFCDLFVLFDRIVSFVLRTLVPPVATLMVIVGGVMFYLSAGEPDKVRQAKGLIRSTVIGILLVYFAYGIVIAVFAALGAVEREGWWYRVVC